MRGFSNQGSNCYMNVALHALLNLNAFNREIIEYITNAQTTQENAKIPISPLLKAYANILVAYYK